MRISYPDVPFSPEHREIARQLWDVLASESLDDDLVPTGDTFKAAPPEVRSAILDAYALMLSQGKIPKYEDNPFE